MFAIANLGENLSRFRKQQGLTLTGLAERCGVAKSTLSNLEAGEGNPTVETLWAIANALRVPFGALVEGVADDIDRLGVRFPEEGSNVRFIERSAGPPEIEVYSVELSKGGRKESAPHPSGVTERVTVLSGAMLVGEPERPKLVRAGESHTFAADVPHIYAADGGDAKAIVFVDYPAMGSPKGESIVHLDWPVTASQWDGVGAVLSRIFIEVSNGIDAKLIRFRGPRQPAQVMRKELRQHLYTETGPLFSWPLLSVMDIDRQGAYVAVLPLRFSTAFSPEAVTDSAKPKNPTLATAISLARLAESPFLRLTDAELKRVQGYLEEPSWILSGLAAEVLTQRGTLAVPSQLKHLARRSARSQSTSDDQAFSSRINVDHYDAFELLHPAYARQVVAVAQDILIYAAQTDPLAAIDVGTGPGVPLLMLHELHPPLNVVAVEPDDVAFACLEQNIRGINAITACQSGFLEMDCPSVPLITSVGASHHFNTAFMLQKAMLLLQPGGVLSVADEFLPEFRNQDERDLALVRHHCAYILTAMAWIGDHGILDAADEDCELYRTFQRALSMAIVEAEAGQTVRAVETCRNLFATLRVSHLSKQPKHAIGAYTRFFWLELQAMVAGFDYEVERKTYPRRFADLARLSGFELQRHRRIFGTTGTDEWGGGTHVFTFRKPSQ